MRDITHQSNDNEAVQMAKLGLLTLVAVLCAAVVSGQDIVLLGDSLSDNGNGYAGNAKLVLQTNDVRLFISQPAFRVVSAKLTQLWSMTTALLMLAFKQILPSQCTHERISDYYSAALIATWIGQSIRFWTLELMTRTANLTCQ